MPDPIRDRALRLVDATTDHIAAAIDDRDLLARLVGGDVAEGWEGFPEALPALLGSAMLASGDGPHWGSLLFVLGEPATLVGLGGFYGPPADDTVELGYAIAPAFQGRGLATDAAAQMVARAFADPAVAAVTAHTLPGPNASTAVLERLGFAHVGEEVDPDEGSVWAWRLDRTVTTTAFPAAP